MHDIEGIYSKCRPHQTPLITRILTWKNRRDETCWMFTCDVDSSLENSIPVHLHASLASPHTSHLQNGQDRPCPCSHNNYTATKQISLFDTACHDKCLKFQFKIREIKLLVNKEVKTMTWPICPPPHEYFTPILFVKTAFEVRHVAKMEIGHVYKFLGFSVEIFISEFTTVMLSDYLRTEWFIETATMFKYEYRLNII